MSKIIRITAATEGFRRAGMAHSKTPTDHPESAFDEAQIQALQAEPALTVQIIDQDSEKPGIEEMLKGSVGEVIANFADASDEVRAAALKIEQASARQRAGVLKALGAQSGPKINSQ